MIEMNVRNTVLVVLSLCLTANVAAGMSLQFQCS
jgi:hypothetical protein